MSALFIHDHKFIIFENQIFSNGGITNQVLNRYESYYGDLSILARFTYRNHNPMTTPLDLDSKAAINFSLKNITDYIELIKKTDVLIVRLPSFIGLLTLPFIRFLKKRYVIEVVGCAFDSLWFHSLKGKLVSVFTFILMRLEVSKAKNVIYVTKHFLQNRYPNHNNSFSCSDVQINNKPFMKNYISIDDIENILVLGFIGNVNLNYRGFKYLIKAMTLLNRPYILKVIGHLPSKSLIKTLEKYNVKDKIDFLGLLKHDLVIEQLDEIDVFIQPSLAEGLSRALLEASSRGCLCVSSDVGGNSEIVNNKYVYKKEDYRKLAEIINNLGQRDFIENEKHVRDLIVEFDENKLNIDRSKFYRNLR
jgi:glycosyltransferase involved in cell wall biosynthesis